jgi:hypothetical protein
MYPVPPVMKILGLAEEFIIWPHMALNFHCSNLHELWQHLTVVREYTNNMDSWFLLGDRTLETRKSTDL